MTKKKEVKESVTEPVQDDVLAIPFVKVEQLGIFPTIRTAYANDVGHDLPVASYTEVRPGTKVQLRHNLAVAIPEGAFGLILPRSSTFVRTGLVVIPGVIDPGYRGEVMTIIHNPTNSVVFLTEGDYVSQILILPYLPARFYDTKKLPPSERGERGFGSSDNRSY